jgi:hypothetical protein
MEKEQINSIIAKYRKLSGSAYGRDEYKAWKYDHFADYIEDNKDLYEDDYYEAEEDLLTDYNEANAEVDDEWEMMFPEGDDDDSITDFLTN